MCSIAVSYGPVVCSFSSFLLMVFGKRKSRLVTSRPLGERSEPCLATKRPTASDEVARGLLVSLNGFPFAFRAKNGEWRDSHLGFQV